MSKGEYNSNKVSVHPALACLLVRKYIQEKLNIKINNMKKEMKEIWKAASGPFMIGVAFTLATVSMFAIHGAIICMACIVLTIEGLERMSE